MIQLNTFEDILHFIELYSPSADMVAEIMRQAYKTIFFDMPNTAHEQISVLKQFYAEHGAKDEKPVFYKIDISVKKDDE